ncbi:MAG: serine protease [Defluviicoccus sp.]|nr:serine protease [Defluviicoccus sp.]
MDNGDLVADFADADFVTVGPFPHPTQMAVMPVVAMKGDYVRAVGTCFAISSQGLVLTARHVIEDALEIDAEGKMADPGMGIGALYAAETGEDDKLGGLLPGRRLHFTNDLDIALMQLNLPIARATGKPLRMPALRLGTRIPRVGEHCAGIGYHAMDWQRSTGIHTHHVKQKYAASQGRVREVHLDRRDDFRLKFPCFRTDCKFVGGMSGGPVIEFRTGAAVGVICSGFAVPEEESPILGKLVRGHRRCPRCGVAEPPARRRAARCAGGGIDAGGRRSGR